MPYIAEPDDQGWGKENEYLISAVHARGLPGIICPLDGVWATTGLNYPTVDLALIDAHVGRLPNHPVTVEDYRVLSAKVEAITGPERLVRPGTSLGPLQGSAEGLLGDFAWVNDWTVLVRRSIYRELVSAGFSIDGAEAQLIFRDAATEPLVELEALCKVKLANIQGREICRVCGRLSFDSPKTMVLDAASYDRTRPLQRIVEMPTHIIFNDDFAECILSRGFTNVVLTTIEVN